MFKKILFVDDEKALRETIKLILERKGFKVDTANDGADAVSKLESEGDKYFTVITDLAMPGALNGMDVLRKCRELRKDLPVIMLTAYGNVETAVEAMQQGAFNFLTKPLSSYEVLVQQINKAIESAALSRENIRLKKEIDTLNEDRYKIVHVSDKMEKIIKLAEKLAPTDETVLITGESGTGKELVARYILKKSNRAEKPFVAFNAAAVTPSLIEAELFGYKKGAFTGAEKNYSGFAGAAEGGTLFIDEIGEMPLSLQSKLLRFIQEKEYFPVGSNHPVKCDIRIIAATNRELQNEINTGTFRSDLFYRISAFRIEIPPLRERIEDIPVLADFLAEKFGKEYRTKDITLSPQFKRKLSMKKWPGNVRELENEIRLFLLSPDSENSRPEITPTTQINNILIPIGEMSMEDIEKKVIIETLKYTDGNKRKTAEILGIGERTIYRKLTEEDF